MYPDFHRTFKVHHTIVIPLAANCCNPANFVAWNTALSNAIRHIQRHHWLLSAKLFVPLDMPMMSARCDPGASHTIKDVREKLEEFGLEKIEEDEVNGNVQEIWCLGDKDWTVEQGKEAGARAREAKVKGGNVSDASSG